ncbi:MAG TPA: NADH-quinone oxidoreductase subunit A [Planctomycetota bacterium]|nr:NADH-quinone oxidoreductase subunit A [Planctomycetota bacterium]
MYFDFANVLVYIVISIGFIFGSLTIGRILRPNHPTPEKLTTYECGEEAIGSAWIQFNVRFYIIALIFLIFDVEIAVLFPWAVIFKKVGLLALAEIFLFVGILVVGFAYVWVKGDLEWLRSLGEVRTEPKKDAA